MQITICNNIYMQKEKFEILNGLSELLEKKLITQEEFNNQKSLLLENKKPFSIFNVITHISRLLTPQVVILIIIGIFFTPMKTLLSSASEIALGDTFSFKVQEALRISDPELKNKIRNLKKEEIITLLNLESSGSFYSIREIEEKGKVKTGYIFNDEVAFFVSLQEKGITSSPEDLSEINKMLENKVIYEESLNYNSYLLNAKRRVYLEDEFSEQELEMIKNSYSRLSPMGEKIYSLILDITSDEFSKLI